MKATRSAGHELPDEGRIFDSFGYRQVEGSTTCSCGTQSPVLRSNASRQLWHKAHLAVIRAGGSGVVSIRDGAR